LALGRDDSIRGDGSRPGNGQDAEGRRIHAGSQNRLPDRTDTCDAGSDYLLAL